MARTSPGIRVGLGYDIHRFAPDPRPLVLGGITIPGAPGLDGHSDADVLSHAIADAILGAAGLPDIGHFFPNTDPGLRGISSLRILGRARDEAAARGYRPGNIDATLIAEKPKLLPHFPAIRARLAEALALESGLIGLKATTNEGIGALGRGEGIAAHAVALLVAG